MWESLLIHAQLTFGWLISFRNESPSYDEWMDQDLAQFLKVCMEIWHFECDRPDTVSFFGTELRATGPHRWDICMSLNMSETFTQILRFVLMLSRVGQDICLTRASALWLPLPPFIIYDIYIYIYIYISTTSMHLEQEILPRIPVVGMMHGWSGSHSAQALVKQSWDAQPDFMEECLWYLKA